VGPVSAVVGQPATAPLPSDQTAKDSPLNGNWVTVLNGQQIPYDAQIEAWTEIGIRLRLQGLAYSLTQNGNTLTSSAAAPGWTDVFAAQMAPSSSKVSLTVSYSSTSAAGDVIQGTVNGQSITLTRDVRIWSPISLTLPGDRPYRLFQIQMLGPTLSIDRESYATLTQPVLDDFLDSCQSYAQGYWQSDYMNGSTLTAQDATFESMVTAVNGLSTTPRSLIHVPAFTNAVDAAVSNASNDGLALTEFSMYFTTAGGRGVRIPFASDTSAIIVTDRPSRSATIGVTITETPNHEPEAAPFGTQLLDLGAMPLTDDATYTQSMMEMLVESNAGTAPQLSATGRSAIAEWYGIMAIEDYRGVAFANPSLDWGYDMTSVQFYGLVVRSLARPGQTDSAGNPIMGQVTVNNVLEPGDPSYADILNQGADMQEFPDMANLKVLATNYLTQAHPTLVQAVHTAFANVVPQAELTTLAQQDIFHFICQNLYDTQERMGCLTGAAATAAITAVENLLAALRADSAPFQAYILANGYTQSNTPAPKATY
jgi:hypothetical protein